MQSKSTNGTFIVLKNYARWFHTNDSCEIYKLEGNDNELNIKNCLEVFFIYKNKRNKFSELFNTPPPPKLTCITWDFKIFPTLLVERKKARDHEWWNEDLWKSHSHCKCEIMTLLKMSLKNPWGGNLFARKALCKASKNKLCF